MDADAWELERIAALGWPGTETTVLNGWMVRAGHGFTGRANSALPLGPPADGAELDEHLAAIRRWYAERDLRTLLQVPVPAATELADRLAGAGWTRQWGARVRTASVATVLDRCAASADLPEPTVTTMPGPNWLSLYRYRGNALPAHAVDVLTAGANPRFHALVMPDGAVAGICRTATAEGWVGVTAVEVADAFRRRGVATHLMRHAAEQARRDGAESVYLQVAHSNDAANALYDRAGFSDHHEYFYWSPPD